MISAFGVDHGEISKSFDSERQRHRRQAGAEGAAAGGSVVSGATATRLARKARTASKGSNMEAAQEFASHADVQRNLHRMAQPQGGTPKTGQNIGSTARVHRQALGHRVESMRLKQISRSAARGGRASALTSAALGAAAFGLHRHDKRGGGRSYSYR